jgi:hypothetical protein
MARSNADRISDIRSNLTSDNKERDSQGIPDLPEGYEGLRHTRGTETGSSIRAWLAILGDAIRHEIRPLAIDGRHY